LFCSGHMTDPFFFLAVRPILFQQHNKNHCHCEVEENWETKWEASVFLTWTPSFD
jgi:hypothetical protein